MPKAYEVRVTAVGRHLCAAGIHAGSDAYTLTTAPDGHHALALGDRVRPLL